MSDLYSRNAITNPGAETGDTTGWDIVNNVSAVSGGYSGDYCFFALQTAQIYQEKVVNNAPPDYLVSAAYLPAYDPPADTTAKAEVELLLAYAGGYFKITKIPFRAEAPAGGV